jgi:hypothetical protein
MDKNQFLIKLSESSKTHVGKRDFAGQTHEQRVFSAVWELESQVNNGGLRGYFGNGPASTAFAPTALRAIGAHQCADIVQEALTLIPTSLPEDLDARWDAMDSLPDLTSEQISALDDRFFAYPDNLTELLFDFVAAHPNVFGPIPNVDGHIG